MKREVKKWKRQLRCRLWRKRLYSPLFLVVYTFAWYTLYRFCLYGGIRRRLPLLGACALFFLLYLIFFEAEYVIYKKKSKKQLYRELEIGENSILLPDGKEYSFGEVRWYYYKKEQIGLFLKGHRFLWLDTEKLTEKNRELLSVKLTQRGLFARQFWRIPMALLLVLVTLAGCCGVIRSGMKYNGKLSWKIDEWKNSRQVTLTHTNLYRDGILGIFQDLGEKTELPESLCLVNAVQIDFQPDGTIQGFDLFLAGYDGAKQYVGSYLVDYRASRSGKMTVWLNGAAADETYDEEKNIQALAEGLSGEFLKKELESEAESDQDVSFRLSYRGGDSFTVTCRKRQVEGKGDSYEEKDDRIWEREYRISRSGMADSSPEVRGLSAQNASDRDTSVRRRINGNDTFRMREKAGTARRSADRVSAAFKRKEV